MASWPPTALPLAEWPGGRALLWARNRGRSGLAATPPRPGFPALGERACGGGLFPQGRAAPAGGAPRAAASARLGGATGCSALTPRDARAWRRPCAAPGTPATPARAAIGRPSRPPRLPRPSHPPLTRLGSLSLSLFPPPPPPPGQHPQDQEGLLQGQGVRQAPAAQGCVWRNGRERRVAVGSRPSSKTTPPLFPSHALFPCPSLPLLLPPPHSHPVQDGQGLPVRAGCVKNEGRERGGHARPPAACVEEAHPLPLPLTTHPRSHGLPFFSLFSLPFR